MDRNRNKNHKSNGFNMKTTSRSKSKKIDTVSSHKNLNPDYYLNLERATKKKKQKKQTPNKLYASSHRLRSITQG